MMNLFKRNKLKAVCVSAHVCVWFFSMPKFITFNLYMYFDTRNMSCVGQEDIVRGLDWLIHVCI